MANTGGERTLDPDDGRRLLDLRRWVLFARVRLRQSARRAGLALVPVLWASVAAFVAYHVAHDLLGHPSPFFAPVAAWICLGFTRNQVPRNVAELGLGAVLGVGIGEAVFLLVGSGGWQLGLGLIVAALAGRILDRGTLFTMQAGVNAMVVIGMGNLAGTTGGVDRMLDAVTGALIAFLVSVLVPRDLVRRPRLFVAGLFADLATPAESLAAALAADDAEQLLDADAQLRGVEELLADTADAINSAVQIARLNPTLRRDRPTLAELGRQLALATRLTHTLELLLRQSRGILQEAGPQPVVAGLLQDAAVALHTHAHEIAHWQEPTESRRQAAALAEACSPTALAGGDWRTTVLVSVMRSVVIDLLQLSGMSRAQARELLPEVGQDEGQPAEAALPEDGSSEVWQADAG